MFQYRKRYEVTCDEMSKAWISMKYYEFQYRKRYEVTCDELMNLTRRSYHGSFNTASGMRSHVTDQIRKFKDENPGFQYRKRYEVTCDASKKGCRWIRYDLFQYRKRYEVTCDLLEWN